MMTISASFPASMVPILSSMKMDGLGTAECGEAEGGRGGEVIAERGLGGLR